MNTYKKLTSLQSELKEFDIERTWEKEDFPLYNGGAVLFKRTRLVKRMVDTFTTRYKDSPYYSNFYFSHFVGTGKTVLLKLFGKELQLRGFVVFMLTAPELNQRSDYFENLTDKMAQDGKQVAVLVDEVQKNVNSFHWDFLLKNAPSNLLVIGTGISDVTETPQFLGRFPSMSNPIIGQLTEEDIPEVLDHFIPKGRADAQWDLKTTALRELLVATGGQLYPFVVLARHLLEPERVKHLSNVNAYLTSKEFYYSDDYSLVRKRCYGPGITAMNWLSHILLEQPGDFYIDKAMKTGFWNGTSFASPLLVQEVFRELLKTFPSNEIKLDFSGKSSPVVEQIIVAGLANMRPTDFKESNCITYHDNERGLAFRWGVCAGSALKEQVWLTSEVVAEERKGKSGAMPTINFVVNGHLNLSLELASDRTDKAMLEKIEMIGKKEVYGRHDSYLLHFVFGGTLEEAVQQVKGFPANMQSRVYTYMRDYNSLLCGTDVVRKGVVRKLATPSSLHPTRVRQFSTLAFSALRRLGRFV